MAVDRLQTTSGWRLISEGPKPTCVVVAWKWENRWYFSQAFEEYGEWTDVNSDWILAPLYWMPLPEDEFRD